MDLWELKREVAKGEGPCIEFKHKLPEWGKFVREIVAFANTRGGLIFIGVDDDGTIDGLKDPQEIEEALELKLPDYIRPLPPMQVFRVPVTRKRSVVVIQVFDSDQKPHLALPSAKAQKGVALIRIEDSSCVASLEMFELLKFEGRERDIKVELGEKEKLLMEYLMVHDSITLKTFCGVAKLNRHTASRTLVHLVKANLIGIRPSTDEDMFFQILG